MQDAESANPVCGDSYARAFMNVEGLAILDAFKDETGPNISNVARARIIDDLLREDLAAKPDLTVVLIGAGFDSRAFRLTGGTWAELDEPQVIEYKNERLPAADCPNELHRIPIDFSTESLEEKLSLLANREPVTVVVEGVLMYLEEIQIRQMLRALHRLFPRHKLICDLMDRKFFEKYGKSMHEKLTGMGASFKFTADNPEKVFLKNGYHRRSKISVIERAVRLGAIKMPVILLKTLMRTLANGYAIYVFEDNP